MCGISGVLTERGPNVMFAARLGQALRHRGPDACGDWIDESAGVGLSHRRLSILDLSPAGAQPMVSADGRWVVAYNGEIYNHRSLRDELSASDQPLMWRGHSDTESLVESIAAWGMRSALARCNGMFAIAAWDRSAQSLTLVRDRTGEKPLYVGWVGGELVFGSEISVFRQHPDWQHAVEERALPWLLQFGYIPAPWTIHPGVYKLPAGSLLELRRADAAWRPNIWQFQKRVEHWWSLGEVIDRAKKASWSLGRSEAVDAVEALVDDAVRIRLQADVSVGALLSGGIDSALVVSSMARLGGSGVRAYTVSFSEPGFDESPTAAEIAMHLGVEHEVVRLSARLGLDLVEELPSIYGEPFADAAQVPAVLVSRAARSKVTVALTGDGGDEFFHGYQRYLDAARFWPWLGRIPSPVREGIGTVLRTASSLVPPGRFSQALLRQAGRVSAEDAEEYAIALLRFTGATPCTMMGDPAYPARADSISPSDLIERQCAIDQMLGLSEGIHTKLDRASMSVGMELRPPLLDHRLIELSWRFPAHWHARHGLGKRILREIVARRLPASIADGSKRGFDVPVSLWLRTSLRSWGDHLIESPTARADPFINLQQLRALWYVHQQGRGDFGLALWAVLMYLAWSARYA